ncbi:RNA-directed DNA polymerase, eukaryota, Reverse transcriptase zinc-binding domain protein [Artemisia annua]|uniref:RNA-directed DNA polymerase, eukaryota, Reverse transcriptase zinc-binding domain protein n=1 Tax=Artemisia annua TaxID=35608 RepID=A0A2U1PVK3_ARTAN|nr:RNA-directed DNA polymerase, eukaryota, Reverse transcriptase zinc-binding domain protein [Artemisia annua]
MNDAKANNEGEGRQSKEGEWQQQKRNVQYKRNNYRQVYREKNTGVDMGKNENRGVGHNNGTGHNASTSSGNDNVELRILKDRMLVDVFLEKKLQPTCAETSKWTKDMIRYFKDQWEIDRLKEKEEASKNQEDVLEERNGKERKEAWVEIQSAKSVTTGWPWLVMGDFNVTMKPMEHSNGGSVITSDMQDLIDGLYYTRIKSPLNPTNSVLKKLDRAMVNGDFLEAFPSAGAGAEYLPYLISDHSPVKVRFPQCFEKKIKPFRFANYITSKEEFLPTVVSEWSQRVSGCKMYCLVKKMKKLKSKMNKLNWKNGNLFERVKSCRDKLQKAQSDLDNNPHCEFFKKCEVQALNEYNTAITDEEEFLFQKANIEWMSKGDRNNEYFHKLLKSRRQASRIMSICDDNGARNNSNEDWDFNGVFGTRLSEEDATTMVREVTDKEVEMAMFDIDGNKAPGPDGYTSTFYKKAWSVMGSEVCMAVKEFFKNGKLFGEVNATLLSMVPKVNTPNKVSDFRPIACCNVIYKCISKILTERIKLGLQKLVNLNQSAFIQGRAIQDNILITQELLKGYDRVVLEDVYDTVDWKFLEQILVQYGFHEKMVRWIMVCITTAKFSVCINGERKGYFSSGRGLRQGDPISPYLFTLVMEVFTLLMAKNAQQNGNFKFHKGCKELKLTHMGFADDLLVVCHGDVESVKVVKESLVEFSNMSGLLPNMAKSIVFFGNVQEEVKRNILQILPFKVGKLPMKYLGVPLITKKLGAKECKQLVDKFKNRVNDWKNKYLSYAEIGTIRATFNFQGLWVKLWANHRDHQLLKGVLWCKGELKRGKAKVAWKDVCRPKSQGGLGIRLLSDWNVALMIKESMEHSHSWMWRTILDLRHKVRANICKAIGNGVQTNVWYDQWSNIGILGDVISTRSIHNARLSENLTVSDMIVNDQWRWPNDWRVQYPVLASINVPKLNPQKQDTTMWRCDDGSITQFSTRIAWEHVSQHHDKVRWWKIVWFSRCNPRMAFILWMAIKRRLQTQDRVMKWNNDPNMKCPPCNMVNDSHSHLFFECEFSKEIWTVLKAKMEINWMSNSWDTLIEQYANKPCNNSIGSVLRRIGSASMVYHIWRERNARLFSGEKTDKGSIMKIIEGNIKLQLKCLKVKKSVQVMKIAHKWNVEMNFVKN